MTFTLIILTIAFLVLQGFQCISKCFYLQRYGVVDGRETYSWYIVRDTYAVAKLGLIVHASLNFFFYCLAGSMFKKELRKLRRQFAVSSRKSSSLSIYYDQGQDTSRTTIVGRNAESEYEREYKVIFTKCFIADF